DDEQVTIVEGDGMHSDQDLAGPRVRNRCICYLQVFDAGCGAQLISLHCSSPSHVLGFHRPSCGSGNGHSPTSSALLHGMPDGDSPPASSRRRKEKPRLPHGRKSKRSPTICSDTCQSRSAASGSTAKAS